MEADHIRIIKLKTGDEIMGIIGYPDADDTSTQLTVENPALVVLQSRKEGDGVGVALIPLQHIKRFNVKNEDVVYDAEPNPDLETYYRQLNNMVAVPPKGLIVPK